MSCVRRKAAIPDGSSSIYILILDQLQQLEYLMPVFWIGFNIAMFPGASLAKRHGALPVIAGALANTLELLIAGQLLAGGAWGCILMASFPAALDFGRTGREGLALGMLFAALALAAVVRMAAAAGRINQVPDLLPVLFAAPFVLWFAGAAVFAALARAGTRPAIR